MFIEYLYKIYKHLSLEVTSLLKLFKSPLSSEFWVIVQYSFTSILLWAPSSQDRKSILFIGVECSLSYYRLEVAHRLSKSLP